MFQTTPEVTLLIRKKKRPAPRRRGRLVSAKFQIEVPANLLAEFGLDRGGRVIHCNRSA